jgi:hypothetical protein
VNLYYAELMEGPSLLTEPYCASCGISGHTERHHVVPRSQGGHDGPLLTLCRECHGSAHARTLHFRWCDGEWQQMESGGAVKQEIALSMQGWRSM